MLNIILKLKILYLKIYSKSNYKTNVFFFFNFFKKKKKLINVLNYIINNLNFYNKIKISKNFFLFLCNYYHYINRDNFKKINNLFLKNIYLKYSDLDLKIIYKYSIIKKIKINLKEIKKIYTRLLFKYNNLICENLLDRLINTVLNIYSNENFLKTKKFFFMFSNYNNNNLFNYFNEVQKTCILLNLFDNKIQKKIYVGLLSYPFKNKPYYFYYLIDYLINYNNLNIELSIDIYHIDLIKIINFLKKLKIIKINLAIGIPDLFIECIIKNKNWILFDPKEVNNYYNYYIQNFHDEYVGFGSFRVLFNKIVKNNNIFKILINSKKLFLKILNIKFLKIFYLDIINRNNINKQISNIFCNFYHSRIYEKINYYKKKSFFFENNIVNFQKSNINCIEIFFKIKINFCKFNLKKIIHNYIISDKKNDILIFNKKENFYLNFKTNPILIKLYIKNKKLFNEYLYYNFYTINCYLSYNSESYCWYYENDISKQIFYIKNKYFNFYWNNLKKLINDFELKNSLYLNIKNNNYNFKITLNNFFIKTLIINWQLKNEIFKF